MSAQLKITLDDDQRSQLDRATEQSGKSLSEEIRERLSLSFLLEMRSRDTADLLFALLRIADVVADEIGFDWSENERARATFVSAVVDQIMSYELRTNPNPIPRLGGARPDDSPEALGGFIARGYRRDRRREAPGLSSLAKKYSAEPPEDT
ncbi:hypothetical protein [Bradyrhizobium sp. 76]|uniref:hypothetical protein n=1 Tax=Bradyrhizobium sp. 76 TaxID=2782680 RepID=UPI001FF80D82|nr:hypothetical protein [Bradyrhizobium sp. 76]MCK1407112.1 hypothetical protein [Bradyrhizobium sp. 76]